MYIINRPIKELFLNLVSETEKTIKICSPYIKQGIVDEIYKAKKETAHISVVTKVNLMDFYKNTSDISALKLILEQSGEVYNFQRLHAKFYIFDDTAAIISSANLTPSGFNRNYEYGMFLDEASFVKQTCKDFLWLCRNESTGKLKNDHTIQIDSILNSLPKPQEVKLPKLELDYAEPAEDIFDKGSEYIERSLTGWKKAVFIEIKALGKQIFTTSDFKHMVPSLQEKYRKNHYIEAKIRQQLQFLRDLGLIKFEGNGVYKKLWK